jgi:hypothetical protein
VFTWLAMAIAGVFRSRAALVAENLCLRQQLLVYQRWRPRPRLMDADRRFWILASRWFSSWRGTLLVASSDTVLGWHPKGWKAYWRWKSRVPANGGRSPIRDELKLLIRWSAPLRVDKACPDVPGTTRYRTGGFLLIITIRALPAVGDRFSSAAQSGNALDVRFTSPSG